MPLASPSPSATRWLAGSTADVEQHDMPFRRLSLQARRKPRAGADRIGQPLARQDEGAAPLLGPQHAVLHQGGDMALRTVWRLTP